MAAVLVQRAEAMATFDDPSAAFIPSNLKIKAGDAWIHLYRVDARIKGFEMMLASSNNKAVENVSAELPASSAVADDATGLRYFAPLSSTLLDRDSWGLIAAVLGNSANRSRFRNTFWWHKDVGLSTYLAAASGNPQVFEEIDPKTQQVVNRRPPRIVTEADAPRDGTEALRRWQAARAGFRKALAKSRKVLAEAAAVREKARALPELARQETEAARELVAEREAEARHRAEVEVAGSRIREVEEELGPLAERLAELDRLSPSFLARLFRTRRAREWSNARAPILAAHKQAREALSTASRTLSEADGGFRDAVNRREKTEQRWAAISQRHKAEQSEIDAVRGRIGHGLLDAEFFNLDHAERHKAVPWLDAVQQRARDEVFVAAVQLHKAFLDGSAKRLRHNLGALMMIFSGGSLPAEKRHMTAELWASLFLIVPLVSTTFASVGRMLGSLPPESLGWLLIDEAGQALPQAAVGAILRTRRAVVLGDPLQIEPVVTLPDQLTFAITRRFGVDPDRFNAPGASAQTLADMATPYYADFPSRQGSRSVGVPLLVHRRCADPMFSIANAIAYEHLMVQAKSPADSAIGSVLGLSCWFNVEGEARDKWCPQEGDLVLRLLWKLPEAGGAPSLYIVTPFVAVADGLRKLILESGVLDRWTDKPREWVYERVGTVHTVQGREAEAVIFVLGAPDLQQTGARGWAGGRPNLLNVAVTRAKERLYVVGNHRLWCEAGLFRDLAARLPVRREP
ncbi:MAG TPA: AAA domain-containing protein [Thermoanaerobaculia bacterium]|nr:AAA domain-containing protein [Thermoanaerobaculia bacterium]